MANTIHSTLKIFLLGRFRVELNEVFIEEHLWTRRSSKQLVKLLALQPTHQLHREQIIDRLWTEQDYKTALNNLNKAIHTARRVFEPELEKGGNSQFIKTSNHRIILCCPGSLFVDIEEFERSAFAAIKNEDAETGEMALALYQGKLLTEDIYEDWLSVKRESLHLLYRKVSNKTAEVYIKGGEYQRALEILKKLCVDDPTDERIHQNLMRLYAMTGSKYQALKQFEQCAASLWEIGMEPEEETVKLKDLIKAGKILPVKFGFDNNSNQLFVSSSQQVSNSSSAASQTGIKTQTRQKLPEIRQLTFQQGVIYTARFSHDRQSVFYSADWESKDLNLYKINRGADESQSIGVNGAGIYSVSAKGDLALSFKQRFVRGFITSGALALTNRADASPVKILEDVQWADWHPVKHLLSDPRQCLAIVRDAGGRNRLEYPVGNVLYETGGWISHPRFSPSGKYLAFIEHPTLADDSGAVAVIDLQNSGKIARRILSDKWISIQGLAWRISDEEIWFTAAKAGNARSIFAVSLRGNNERLVFRGIGSLTLQDLSDSGEALITVDKTRVRIVSRPAGDTEERDLSWHDWSLVRDISDDGKMILFTEAGESGGDLYSTYVYKTNGAKPVRLGNGSALALSPDHKYALVKLLNAPNQLVLLPVGDGMTKVLKRFETKPLNYHPWACWFPDEKKVLFAANPNDGGTRLYVQSIEGSPQCITPDMEGVEISSPRSISPDGKLLAMIDPERRICFFSFKKNSITGYPQIEPNYLPVRWSGDGKHIYIRERGAVPAVVYRYGLSGGQIEPVYELIPKDKTGVHEILRVLLTPDGKSYAYSYTRDLSDLFVIEGLR